MVFLPKIKTRPPPNSNVPKLSQTSETGSPKPRFSTTLCYVSFGVLEMSEVLELCSVGVWELCNSGVLEFWRIGVLDLGVLQHLLFKFGMICRKTGVLGVLNTVEVSKTLKLPSR